MSGGSCVGGRRRQSGGRGQREKGRCSVYMQNVRSAVDLGRGREGGSNEAVQAQAMKLQAAAGGHRAPWSILSMYVSVCSTLEDHDGLPLLRFACFRRLAASTSRGAARTVVYVPPPVCCVLFVSKWAADASGRECGFTRPTHSGPRLLPFAQPACLQPARTADRRRETKVRSEKERMGRIWEAAPCPPSAALSIRAALGAAQAGPRDMYLPGESSEGESESERRRKQSSSCPF